MSDIVKGVVVAGRSAGENYLTKVIRLLGKEVQAMRRMEWEVAKGYTPSSGHRHLPLFRAPQVQARPRHSGKEGVITPLSNQVRRNLREPRVWGEAIVALVLRDVEVEEDVGGGDVDGDVVDLGRAGVGDEVDAAP